MANTKFNNRYNLKNFAKKVKKINYKKIVNEDQIWKNLIEKFSQFRYTWTLK